MQTTGLIVLWILKQVPSATSGAVPLDGSPGVIASAGRTRLRVAFSARPGTGSDAKQTLELCSGDRCSAFVCPGYGENDVLPWFFGEAAPWPGRGHVALVEYFQSGTGSIPAFFRLILSNGAPRCQAFEPPLPSKSLPGNEEVYWGVYELHRDGRLEYRAGSYKKGRTDACRACRPDTVLQCSWKLEKTGFAAQGCALSTPTE